VNFELRVLELLEAGPVILLRHAHVPVVRGLAAFVGHLEEDEVSELLEVVAVAHAVVAEGRAEAPDFGDDGFGGHWDDLGLRVVFFAAFLAGLFFEAVVFFTAFLVGALAGSKKETDGRESMP